MFAVPIVASSSCALGVGGLCCSISSVFCIGDTLRSGTFASILLFLFTLGLAIFGQMNISLLLSNDRFVLSSLSMDTFLNCEPAPSCSQTEIVLRIATSSVLYFLASSVLVSCWKQIHDRYWGFKCCSFVFMLLSSLYLPHNSLVRGYSLVAFRTAGSLFLIVQTVILVDMSHRLNRFLLDFEGPSHTEKWSRLKFSLVCFYVLIESLPIGILIYLLCMLDTHSLNWYIILTCLFVATSSTVYQLRDVDSKGSLLTAGVMASYLCWHTVSTVIACDSHILGDTWKRASTSVGVFFVLCSSITIGISAVTTSKPENNELPYSISQRSRRGDYGAIDYEKGAHERQPGSRDSSSPVAVNLSLAFGAAGWSMILTNWGLKPGLTLSGGSTGSQFETAIDASTGLLPKVCATLYAWILIAPRLFPDRDFS